MLELLLVLRRLHLRHPVLQLLCLLLHLLDMDRRTEVECHIPTHTIRTDPSKGVCERKVTIHRCTVPHQQARAHDWGPCLPVPWVFLQRRSTHQRLLSLFLFLVQLVQRQWVILVVQALQTSCHLLYHRPNILTTSPQFLEHSLLHLCIHHHHG